MASASKWDAVDVVVVDSDQEDDAELDEDAQFEKQMAEAMERSFQESQSKRQVSANQGGSEAGPSTSVKRPRSDDAPMSRAEMEAARRARAKAALANGAKTVRVGPEVKRPRVGTLGDVAPAEDGPSTIPSGPSSSSSNSDSNVHRFSSTSSTSKGKSIERYWDGELKRVSNIYCPDSDSLSYNDVLGPKNKLVMAILSAFVWDLEWIMSMVPQSAQVLLIMPRSKEDPDEVVQMSPELHPSTYVVKPAMPADEYGCMHVKGLWLFYNDFCRLVIPSANNVDFDWQRIDNAMYIQDFPARPAATEAAHLNPTHTDYSRDMLEYLKVLGTPNKFIAPFKGYDFSTSKDVQFVSSAHGQNCRGWGKMKEAGGISSVARAVKRLNFSKGGVWEIEVAGSSLGAYQSQANWLAQMIGACRGIDGEEYFSRDNRAPPGVLRTKIKPFELPIKIVFPTLSEVDQSIGGREGGGTIFCPSKNWKDYKFPRALFYRGESKRRGTLAHTKHILALHKPDKASGPDFEYRGWCYIGSHNFTRAAWGEFVQAQGKAPSTSISNYECGVIIPFRASSEKELEEKANKLVTYQRPLVPYSATDIPWMQDLHLPSA